VGFNATQEASQKTRNIVQVIEFAILTPKTTGSLQRLSNIQWFDFPGDMPPIGYV
jgi:hypothetical protein